LGLKPDGIQRLGVFGGAFDPPHAAHVALVEAAIRQLALAQVRVLPTGEAWHKQRPLSSAVHRFAMCQLAFEHLPQVVVDARETQRAGPSYTVDTLTQLQNEFAHAHIFLLLGDDQRRSLPHWHQIEQIGRIAIICAAGRDQGVRAWSEENNTLLTERSLPDTLQARLQTLDMPLMPHSATGIRDRLAKDQPISGLVPPAVERYIHEHHLYRPH
jgi:nicotinate-nucleotide adenylyltransferase